MTPRAACGSDLLSRPPSAAPKKSADSTQMTRNYLMILGRGLKAYVKPGGTPPLKAFIMRFRRPPFMLFMTRCISRNCLSSRFTS